MELLTVTRNQVLPESSSRVFKERENSCRHLEREKDRHNNSTKQDKKKSSSDEEQRKSRKDKSYCHAKKQSKKNLSSDQDKKQSSRKRKNTSDSETSSSDMLKKKAKKSSQHTTPTIKPNKPHQELNESTKQANDAQKKILHTKLDKKLEELLITCRKKSIKVEPVSPGEKVSSGKHKRSHNKPKKRSSSRRRSESPSSTSLPTSQDSHLPVNNVKQTLEAVIELCNCLVRSLLLTVLSATSLMALRNCVYIEFIRAFTYCIDEVFNDD